MVDLVEFLHARLDEDERLAQAGRVEGDLFIDFKPTNGDEEGPGEAALLAHIGNWDPIRVLAEVKVKRRIISRCESLLDERTASSELDWAADFLAHDVLRDLAAPHASHPDYSPSWAPADEPAP